MTSVVWTDAASDLSTVAERLRSYRYEVQVKNGAVHVPRAQLPLSARLSEQLNREGLVRDQSEIGPDHVAYRPRRDVR
jgi:hypothetical protein